jgi:hypothetical protein
VPYFLNESLEKTPFYPFHRKHSSTDMKGNKILRALKNLSLVEKDCHVTFNNAYWAQRRAISCCHLTIP